MTRELLMGKVLFRHIRRRESKEGKTTRIQSTQIGAVCKVFINGHSDNEPRPVDTSFSLYTSLDIYS
jgi:hypothetical protein